MASFCGLGRPVLVLSLRKTSVGPGFRPRGTKNSKKSLGGFRGQSLCLSASLTWTELRLRALVSGRVRCGPKRGSRPPSTFSAKTRNLGQPSGVRPSVTKMAPLPPA